MIKRFIITKDQILFHCRFFTVRVWIASKKDWKRRAKRIKRYG